MNLKFNSYKEVLTGILYRFNKNTPSVESADQTGELAFRVNHSKITSIEQGGFLLIADFSAYMQVTAFFLEIDGTIILEIDGIEPEEIAENEALKLEIKNIVQNKQSELFKDPINRLVTQVLESTPTRPD